MPTGRPSDYTEELADYICVQLADGRSLVEICAEDGMPHRATVIRWLAKHQTFRDMYALAREMQAEVFADELIDISDDGRNDWMARNADDDIGWSVNGEAIQRSKLRVDTRKWVASKLLPRKYGDASRIEHTGRDGGPIETTSATDRERAKAVAAMILAQSKGE